MHLRIQNIKYTIFLVLLGIVSLNVYPQAEIQREVRVVKPYSPTLSDAEKINLLPDMSDTLNVRPDFSYKIIPKWFETQFQPENIKAARMVGLPIEKLYKTLLTLGAGNYNTPLAEVNINQLRSRNSAMGLYLRHHSSSGKMIKADRVYKGFSDNQADFYSKWFLNQSVIEADASTMYQSLHYYGYNTAIDTVLDRKEIRQGIFMADAAARYYSVYTDSSRLKHKSGIKYQFTGDRFDNTEHSFHINTDLGKKFGAQYVGLALSVDHYKVSRSIDSLSNTIYRLNPFISKKGNEWLLLAGFKAAADVRGNDPEFKLYPKGLFEFNIVRGVLRPYLSVDGYRQENNYRKILNENPFVIPGQKTKNTNYGIIADAGLKGRYSTDLSFNLSASFSMIKNMNFFVNDTLTILSNQFAIDYDDVILTTWSGEIIWKGSEKLELLLKGKYHKYQLSHFEYAWHKPDLELWLGLSYDLRDKILLDANLFYTGERFAPSRDPFDDPVKLKAFLDANLKIEYRYTSLLSFFLKFNNFTASKYQIWHQYPAQRFQFMAGFSYTL